MNIKKTLAAGLSIGVLMLPALAFASPILRSGDSVSVEADQVLEGDFYGVGGTVTISGKADSDVYVAGSSVTINAPVGQDLGILGGTVNVHAPVEDDVRVIGGEVTLADHVGGDVVVFGGTLKVLSTASIDGDIMFYGGNVDISGPVKGSIIGRAETIRIDSSIGKDVSVKALRSLTLGDRAEIVGNLDYESASELARAQGAVVVGDIQKKIIPPARPDLASSIVSVLVLLFSALTGYLLFKPEMQRIADRTAESYGTQGLVGLGVLLAVPFVGILLLASVLGAIVGVVVLVAYALLLFTSWILSGVVLGTLLFKYFMKSPQISLLSAVIGVIIFDLLHFVPYIGPILAFATFVIVLGGVSARLYRLAR